MSMSAGPLADMLPPPRHLAAIGRVVAVWGYIENNIEAAILGLYEIDLGRGLIFTNSLSFFAQKSMLTILAKEGAFSDEAIAKEFLEILPRLEAAKGLRNDIVHAAWKRNSPDGIIRRLAVRVRAKKIQLFDETYTAGDILKIADGLEALAVEFADLCRRAGVLDKLAAAPKHSSHAAKNSS